MGNRKKEQVWQCHQQKCREKGVGRSGYLHNLTRHFKNLHPDIEEGGPDWPKKENQHLFWVGVQVEPEMIEITPLIPTVSQPQSPCPEQDSGIVQIQKTKYELGKNLRT